MTIKSSGFDVASKAVSEKILRVYSDTPFNSLTRQRNVITYQNHR